MIQLKTDSNSKKLTYHALSAEETKQCVLAGAARGSAP